MGGFWTERGCYFPPSTFPQIEWKLIYAIIEDGVWRWWFSLHLFSFCHRWCSEVWGVDGLSLIARTIQDGEPIHQVIHFPLMLHQTRSMAKSCLVNQMNTTPGVQPCPALLSPCLVSEAVRHMGPVLHSTKGSWCSTPGESCSTNPTPPAATSPTPGWLQPISACFSPIIPLSAAGHTTCLISTIQHLPWK